MTKPVRERIVDLVAAALEQIDVAPILLANPTPTELAALGKLGDEGGRVAIARDGLPDVTPALSVEDRGDTFVVQDGFATRWLLSLEILADTDAEGVEAAADVGRELSRRYNRLAADVARALLLDPQWGGLAMKTDLGDLDVEIAEGGDPRAATTAQLVRIQYATRTGDPFTSAS